MLKVISAVVASMLLQMPASTAAEESQWYKPNVIKSHEGHPNFDFLLGDWESSDPSIVFKESWNTTAKGDLFGYRSNQTHESDLFAFEPVIKGAVVTMRRMGSQLCDLEEEPLHGSWSAPTSHRGEITFHGEDEKDETILNKYDSPDPNTLNLQIQTTSKDVNTSQVFRLKRSAPRTLDPNL